MGEKMKSEMRVKMPFFSPSCLSGDLLSGPGGTKMEAMEVRCGMVAGDNWEGGVCAAQVGYSYGQGAGYIDAEGAYQEGEGGGDVLSLAGN